MNNRTTTQLLAVSAAIIGSLCLYSTKADAQFNGSNSSGSNTTSFSGAFNSIWNSNRKETPIQKLIPPVTYERPIEVVPETVTVTASCPPIIKGENTVINYNTSDDCPIITVPAYPRSTAPRGRG